MHYSKVKFRRKLKFRTKQSGPFSEWLDGYINRAPVRDMATGIKMFSENELKRDTVRANRIFEMTHPGTVVFDSAEVTNWEPIDSQYEIEVTQSSVTYLLHSIIDFQNIAASRFVEDSTEPRLVEFINISTLEMLIVDL